MSHSLVAHISEVLTLSRDAAEFDDLLILSVSYLTGGLTAFEFQKEAKPLLASNEVSAKDFRLSLHRSGYSFSLKCWLLCIARPREIDRVAAKREARRWDIDLDEDFPCCWQIFKKNRNFRVRLRSHARSAHRAHAITPENMRAVFDEVFPDVAKYTRFLVNRKLSFIVKSQNLTYGDPFGELAEKALVTFYKLMPCAECLDYIGNYIRRSVHNTAMNIIKANTSLKAGRLIATDSSRKNFQLLVVSENQLNARLSGEDAVTYDSVGGFADMSGFESEFSLTQLLERYAGKTKRLRCLLIMLGQTDDGFTDWLRGRRIAGAEEDNADVQDRLPSDEFNRLVSQYLHLAEDKLNVFLLRVRKELGHAIPAASRTFTPHREAA